MNRLTVIIALVGLIALMMVIESSFKPRLDRTVNNDLLLWYYNRDGERVFIILHHFQ